MEMLDIYFYQVLFAKQNSDDVIRITKLDEVERSSETTGGRRHSPVA